MAGKSKRDRETSRDVERNRIFIAALSTEVDQQRASHLARNSSLTTRASILVASASILTGLQIRDDLSSWFYITVFMSAAAAALGVIVLLPRMGDEVSIASTETEYWGQPETVAIRNFMHHKLSILKKDEKSLRWRRLVLLLGFTLLALAILTAALNLSDIPGLEDWNPHG